MVAGWQGAAVRSRRWAKSPGRDSQSGAHAGRRGAGDLGSRHRQRRRAQTDDRQQSRDLCQWRRRVPDARASVVHDTRSRGEASSTLLDSRPGAGPGVVTRRHPPRVCQRARRSQLHRLVRSHREGDSLPRPERRSRRQSDVVARRITHRVHPHASDGRDLHVRASPRSATLVDPRR